MNVPDPDHEMEKLLGRLAPPPPGAELMARLQASCPAPARKVIRFPLWLAVPAAAAAAAAAVLLAFVFHHPPEAKRKTAEIRPPEPEIIPLERRQHLMEVADFGIVEDRDDKPVRLIRTTWVDEFVYTVGPTGKRMTDSRVRQEILPVSIQTF